MAENVSPSVKVKQTEDATQILVEMAPAKSDAVLRVAPDFEKERADRKRRLEYNDRYGEPMVPGGILSVAQEEGEENIPPPAGGVTTVPGQLNLAAELHRTQQEKAARDEQQQAVP